MRVSLATLAHVRYPQYLDRCEEAAADLGKRRRDVLAAESTGASGGMDEGARMDYRDMQPRIVAAMAEGATIDDVDEQLIESSDLDGEHKAALWLYAWSFLDHASQRREAIDYLLALG